jgi:sugar/nucleoside kinase (ribokinase family)
MNGANAANTARVGPQRLVLVGSILVDILMYVDRLPERGGDIMARRTLLTSGGGFNVLIAATRLGMPTAYAGRVGDGPMGHQVVVDLAAAHIPLLLPAAIGTDTGFDIGLVEPDHTPGPTFAHYRPGTACSKNSITAARAYPHTHRPPKPQCSRDRYLERLSQHTRGCQ